MEVARDEYDDVRASLTVPPLYGPSKKRQLRKPVSTRMRTLGTLRSLTGSDETKLQALRESKGLAAVLNNVGNSMYQQDSKALFASCRLVHLHWDESNYHGLSVNLGLGIDVVNRIGSYLRPSVMAEIE